MISVPIRALKTSFSHALDLRSCEVNNLTISEYFHKKHLGIFSSNIISGLFRSTYLHIVEDVRKTGAAYSNICRVVAQQTCIISLTGTWTGFN